MDSARAGVKVVSRWQAGRVRRGSRALSAVFREPPRESATGGVCAVSSAGGRVDASPCSRRCVEVGCPIPVDTVRRPAPVAGRLPAQGTFSAIIPTNGRCSISSNSFLTRSGKPRYRPIAFALPRIATEYLELAGVRIPAERSCLPTRRQPRPSSIQRSRPIRYHPRQHGRHVELRQRCALLLGLTPGPARTRPSPDRDGPAHAQPAPYRTSPVVVDDRGRRTTHSVLEFDPGH